jgi:probable HAF family extracellular repeat protein
MLHRLSQSLTARGSRLTLVPVLVAFAVLAAQARPATAAGAAAGPGYRATILSTLCTGFRGGPCPAFPLSNGAGISDSGWIVGNSNYPGTWVDPNNPNISAAPTEHATVWRDGKITDLGTLGGPNSSIGFVARPNNTGLISGNAQTATLDPNNEGWALNLGCTPTDASCDGSQYAILGFVWQNGVMRPLPTLGGNNALGFGVANDQGQLAGTAENAHRDPTCQAPQVLDWEAVVWGPQYGAIHELPPYHGDRIGAAAAINDHGQVVGGSGPCEYPSVVGVINHALLWQGGKTINLGSLGGNHNNLATAINNSGQVIGFSDLSGDTTFHAFLWQNGMMTDLGTLPGDAYSIPLGINDAGQVVGQSCDQNDNCRAFLWQNGMMSDLNQVTHVNGPFCLVIAAGINSQGEIAGMAVDERTGNTLGFSAMPSTNPPAGNQGCNHRAQNATGTDTPNAPSRVFAPRPVHRPMGLGILQGTALRPTVQSW